MYFDDEIPKYRPKKKYKKKDVVVEARYIKQDSPWIELFNNGEWFKWSTYLTKKGANLAISKLNRTRKSFEFRIKE